jgi:hypothetical protein
MPVDSADIVKGIQKSLDPVHVDRITADYPFTVL